uniref:NADH-ubiquinone oxidoreductase chain 2 n=3 Tax=Alytes obstetricans pertinax TaxID=171366 RepID=Q5MQQ8_ALYOB|nr:NADH dehydrogenase subunit 2 [Alytes obstetricans pertinax]AAS83356.1 NADH dehydrogenase subunit 2 [Alytes obstetricans pertinax]
MSPLTIFILLSSLATGTITVFSSYHWFLAWVGLEINTLAIIPLMTKQYHPRAVEASIKYFLTQAAASALLLFAATNNAWVTGTWDILNLTSPLSTTSVTIALLMKLGVAPFHFWLPEVLQGITLQTGLILSTWQKLAPLTLIIQSSSNLNMSIVLLFGIISTLVGGWGGLNQTQLRKIMAYSSIAHLGWMMTILPISPTLTTLNLILYITMTSTLFLMMMTLSTTSINSLTTMWPKMPALTAITVLTLLSLGGLPPLSGFMPKWLILQELTKQNMPAIATIMALSALLSLFFYLRIAYSMTLTISPNTSSSSPLWRFNPSFPKLALPLLTSLALFILPLTPLILSAV